MESKLAFFSPRGPRSLMKKIDALILPKVPNKTSTINPGLHSVMPVEGLVSLMGIIKGPGVRRCFKVLKKKGQESLEFVKNKIFFYVLNLAMNFISHRTFLILNC